jgi:hypothetical protein
MKTNVRAQFLSNLVLVCEEYANYIKHLGFQEAILTKLVELQSDVRELLRRTAQPSEGSVIIAGAPNLPIGSVTEFSEYNDWLKKEDNLNSIVRND